MGFAMTRGMVEGDLCAHGMAHEADRWGAQVFAEPLEVGVECADLEFFGIVGVAVPAKIECQNVVVLREFGGHMIPPVGIGPPSVEQHEGRILFVPPMEHIEKSAGTKRMGESLGSGFHGSPRYPSRRLVSTVFGKALLFSGICIAFVMVFENYSESVKTVEIGVKPPFPTIVRFLSRYFRVSRPGWIARIASFRALTPR